MDPNVTLVRLREIISSPDFKEYGVLCWEEQAEIAELLEALDGWMSKGGFLPKAWCTHLEDFLP